LVIGNSPYADQAINSANGMIRRLLPQEAGQILNTLPFWHRRRIPMKVRTIGIDLGKTSFHLIGMDERGNVVLRRRFSRTQLITYISKLDTCLIGMEACSGSNLLGRTLRTQGHTVRLIPAQFVRPFVKSNKNDYNDAAATPARDKLPTVS
jgi:hypothetical protein